MLNHSENSESLSGGQQQTVSTTLYEPNGSIYSLVTNGLLQMEQMLPSFIEELQKLCLIESPSDYPPGLHMMAEQLALLLQDVGMQTEIIEDPRGSALLGTLNGDDPSGPNILLLGHHDTVHPVGVAQARVHIEEDKFFGPGTVDMKAGLLQGIYALKLLKLSGYQDFHKILFLSVPDEEISSRYHVGLIRQIAQEYRPIVLGLEGGHSIGNAVIRRKGCAHYRLTAQGQAAHAGSSPEKGRNAVVELAHQIVQAQSFQGWRSGFTINAGPIKGGSRANIVSDFAEILFDIRFLRPEDRTAAEDHWQELLQNHLIPDVKLTLQREPSMMVPMVSTDQSLEIAYRMRLICEKILQTSLDAETRGGASDCCNTAAEGCPTIDGLGAIGGGAHTANEYIILSSIKSRSSLLAGLIVGVSQS